MEYAVFNQSNVTMTDGGSSWQSDPILNLSIPISIVVNDTNPAARTLLIVISGWYIHDRNLSVPPIPVP